MVVKIKRLENQSLWQRFNPMFLFDLTEIPVSNIVVLNWVDEKGHAIHHIFHTVMLRYKRLNYYTTLPKKLP